MLTYHARNDAADRFGHAKHARHRFGVDQLVFDLFLRNDAHSVLAAHAQRRFAAGFDGFERVLCVCFWRS